MTKTIRYVNLTNGIEWLDELGDDVRFCRIQSTALEQKRFGFVISDLDNEFILHWVQGRELHVYDASAKKKMTRALNQGTAWIQYVFLRYFFGLDWIPEKVWVNKSNVRRFFDRTYRDNFPSIDRKLKYFKKFLCNMPGRIACHCRRTQLDGKYERYCDMLYQIETVVY